MLCCCVCGLHIRTIYCSSPGQSEAGDTETETGVDTDGYPYRGRATHPTAGEAEGEDRQESQPAPRHHDQRLRGVLETKHGSKDTVLPAESYNSLLLFQQLGGFKNVLFYQVNC